VNLCLVIALDSAPRNPKLLEQIRTFIPDPEIRLIRGLTPSQIPISEMYRYKDAAESLLGRNVSPEEIACSLSHNYAQKIAAQTKSKSTFIFEDDADIKANRNIEDFLTKQSLGSKPTISTFYGKKWSIWLFAGAGVRALIPPAGAVAYWINSSALDVIDKRDPIGLADWPTWSSRIAFLLSDSIEVRCIEGPSTVRLVSQASCNHVKKNRWFLNSRKSKLSPLSCDVLRYRYLYPLLWKALTKIQRMISGKSDVSDHSIYLHISRKVFKDLP